MIETKYRVWDTKGKSWVSCNVLVDYSGLLFWQFAYDTRLIEDSERYDVQYFTGFKDEDGIEIYAGDVLDGDFPDLVFWNKVRGQWMLQNSEGPDDTLWEIRRDNEPKIIGNIYENPELIP